MAPPLRPLLAGGDRRSIARGPRALALVRRDAARVAELAALTRDADWLVAMRALDLLEKLAHRDPALVAAHKRVFIGPLAEADSWEMHLQIVRALPLFRWPPAARVRVLEILRRDVSHPQTFVRAWALDSLSQLALTDARLLPDVRRHLKTFDASGSKALAARARQIRARLDAATARATPASDSRTRRGVPAAPRRARR
jgi:hypothetical protein